MLARTRRLDTASYKLIGANTIGTGWDWSPPNFDAPGPAMHWSPPTFGPTTDLTNCVNAPLADCQSVSVAAHQPHLYLWPIFLSISMTVHCTSCLLPGTSLYSTEYRRVTDGQTDRQTDRHLAMAESALSIRVAASCSKNASKCTIFK